MLWARLRCKCLPPETQRTSYGALSCNCISGMHAAGKAGTKRKLEAEPGTRRIRRSLVIPLPDGTKETREMIFLLPSEVRRGCGSAWSGMP